MRISHYTPFCSVPCFIAGWLHVEMSIGVHICWNTRCSIQLITCWDLHWSSHMLEHHMLNSVDISTTNDDRTKLRLPKCIAYGQWISLQRQNVHTLWTRCFLSLGDYCLIGQDSRGIISQTRLCTDTLSFYRWDRKKIIEVKRWFHWIVEICQYVHLQRTNYPVR